MFQRSESSVTSPIHEETAVYTSNDEYPTLKPANVSYVTFLNVTKLPSELPSVINLIRNNIRHFGNPSVGLL